VTGKTIATAMAKKGRADKGCIPAATARIEAKFVGTPLSSD
jgi:hypothetical protein